MESDTPTSDIKEATRQRLLGIMNSEVSDKNQREYNKALNEFARGGEIGLLSISDNLKPILHPKGQ